MTADAVEFRARHRAYGVAVPLTEVSPLLACGWRLADPEEAYHDYPVVMLTPPCQASGNRHQVSDTNTARTPDARSLIPVHAEH
jgi:hypothetical protein